MNIVTLSMRTAAAVAVSFVVCAASADNRHPAQGPAAVYTSTVLVSNGSIPAPVTDQNLVNAWGVAFNPNAFAWVNSADGGKAVLYDGMGNPQQLVVNIPGTGDAAGHPTGIVFTGGEDFVVTSGQTQAPARFIFATEEGTLAAWSPDVDMTNAVQVADHSGDMAAYTGLALSGDGTMHLLYACNFSAGRIDVFDGSFKDAQAPGGFTDPNLPEGYSPFGIQAVNGDLYVTYAKQEEDNPAEEEKGPGLGFVNVFDPQGNLIRRVASQDVLNAPWGIALAPASFGEFGGALLVGNLGDGRINAYDPRDGRSLGALSDAQGNPLSIDGLWAIQFGNGVDEQPTNALFWAAGPNDESGGAYGVVTAAPAGGMTGGPGSPGY